MRYKEGDKVRVRTGLVQNKQYGSCFWDAQDGMGRFAGKIMTVDFVYEDKYRMLEDDGEWSWTDGMLEPVSKHDDMVASTAGAFHYIGTCNPNSKSWAADLFRREIYRKYLMGDWELRAYGDCSNSELLDKLGIEKVVFGEKFGRAITYIRMKDGREGKATQDVQDAVNDWQIGFGQAYFKALVGKPRYSKLISWIAKNGKYIRGEKK